MGDSVRVWMIFRHDLVDFDQPTIPQLLYTDPETAVADAELIAKEQGRHVIVMPVDVAPPSEWAEVAAVIQ